MWCRSFWLDWYPILWLLNAGGPLQLHLLLFLRCVFNVFKEYRINFSFFSGIKQGQWWHVKPVQSFLEDLADTLFVGLVIYSRTTLFLFQMFSRWEFIMFLACSVLSSLITSAHRPRSSRTCFAHPLCQIMVSNTN